MPRIVSTPNQVANNIRSYARLVLESRDLQDRIGRVHAWYAIREEKGGWLFGPSKFVGYVDITPRDYLKLSGAGLDGRETERALEKLFSAPADPYSRAGAELFEALARFLSRWGKAPRKDARITVVDEGPAPMSIEFDTHDLIARHIVSNPAICAGRPCIRGTRIRVTDILDMLANSASGEEILADYPDLKPDHLRAALAYGAHATDHRIIKAA